jgi:branched-chain amino acid transport system substrate-binding protein
MRVARFLFLAPALVMLACSGSGGGTGTPGPVGSGGATGSAKADAPIIVGAAIALSGPLAPFDDGPYKAIQLAIDNVNAKGGMLGRPLKLIIWDTKSDISYGATAAQNVIDKGASMVVVTCDYDYGSAAANIANDRGLITFASCAGDPKFGPDGIGPNAYTMSTSSVGEAALMAEWANSKGFETAYVLLQTDTAFDASFADSFKKRWINLRGVDSFLGEDTFSGEDPQIATQITRLKSLPKPPDFILVSAAPPSGVGAVKQLRAASVDQPFLASDSWDGDYWLSGVPTLGNMYFVTYASMYGTDPRPAMRSFFDAFKAKFGRLPTQSNALTGYSVIEAWVRAVERAKSLDSDKVRHILDAFKDEPLLVGPTTYTPQVHINNGRDMVVMEIENGKQGKTLGVFAAHGVPK